MLQDLYTALRALQYGKVKALHGFHDSGAVLDLQANIVDKINVTWPRQEVKPTTSSLRSEGVRRNDGKLKKPRQPDPYYLDRNKRRRR